MERPWVSNDERLIVHIPTEHSKRAENPRSAAFASGTLGGLAMSALLLLGRGLGLSRLNLEMIWGAWLTARTGALAWAVGLIAHLLMAGAMAGVYLWAFGRLSASGWRAGMAVSIPHLALGGLLLSLLPDFHPLIPGALAAPGTLGEYLGIPSILFFAGAHLLYGAIVGALNHPRARPRASATESAER